MLTSGLPAYDNTTVFVDRLMRRTWRSLQRCALRVPRTHGAGCSREGFPRLRTRANVEAVRLLLLLQLLKPVSGSRGESCLTTSPNNTLWTVQSTATTTTARGLGELLDVTGLGRQLTWIGL